MHEFFDFLLSVAKHFVKHAIIDTFYQNKMVLSA